MPRPAAPRRHATALAGAVLCLLLVGSLGACSSESRASGQQQAAPVAERTAGVTLAAAPVETKARFHRIYGRLPDPRRKAVRRQVTAVVERWWEAAYLGGSYPRARFRDAFPGFTAGARARARQDGRLMSNRDIGRRVESVTAERGVVRLDVLAVGRRAQAVTARFVLRFATTGRRAGTTVVRGRLFLTRRHGPWRIFGYDVSKGARA